MSIAVGLDELRQVSASHERAPYFLTVGDDGRPHSVQTDWQWDGDEIELPVGNRTLGNARSRPLVALVWPADERGGYSLIVDGEVVDVRGTGSGDNLVRVRPTRAVMHRPATGVSESACGADCVPILDER